MMRWNHFPGSLAFAAAAAVGYPLFALAAAPLLGATVALALYLLGGAVVYVSGMGPPGRRAVPAAAGLLLAGCVALLAGSPEELAAGAALVVGCCRSGLLYRARPLRALVLEAALGIGGLLVARLAGGAGLLGTALGIWGFLLVQSCFFLVGGAGPQGDAAEGIDPFELARDRVLALLDDHPR